MAPSSRTSGAFGLVAILALGGAALFNLGLAVLLLGRPDETRYGEAIIYDHAARTLRGEALYQPLDQPPYTIATYTPLYYALVALLRHFFGPGFLIGRLVSFGAGLVMASLVAWLVWRRTRALWPSALGALLLVGLGLVGPVPWTAAYKEDVLGAAFALACFAALDTWKNPLPGGLLAGFSILTKQSLLGPAVFGTLWLLRWRRNRAALIFAATVVAVVGGTLVALAASGQAVLDNVVFGNLHQPFDRLTFDHNAFEFSLYQGLSALVALVAVVAMLVLRGEKRGDDVLAFNWLASLGPMLALGAIGADYNYWLHFAGASAALVAVAVWRWRAHWVSRLVLLGLAVNAVCAVYGQASWLLARPATLGDPQVDRTMATLVARVAKEPGTVLADPLDVLVLADRPILLEPIVYSLREEDGTWDPSPLVARICDGEVRLVVLGYPLEELPRRVPPSIARAVQARFEVEQQARVGNAPRYVLVPRGAARC